MSVPFLLKNLIASLLLPPGNGLWLLVLAGVFRRRRWAAGLAVFAGALLFAQSLPPVAHLLIAPLEHRAGPVLRDPAGARAIVILGGGLERNAPEYGGETAHARTLVRVRYGATLAHRYPLPVLVSGGRPTATDRSEAGVMADILRNDYGIDVRWIEAESNDTADNARLSAAMLKRAGIRRIVLVTQAFHMPRARALFEQAGLEVVPAPTGFMSGRGVADSPLDWLPQAFALHTSYYALHEWLGLAWTALRA